MNRLTTWVADVYEGRSTFRPKDILTVVGAILFFALLLVGNALVA